MSTQPKVYETIVSHAPNGLAVQLHVADAPKDSEGATFRLTLLATIAQPKTQIVEGLQIDAIEQAMKVLRALRDELYQQIPPRAQSLLREG